MLRGRSFLTVPLLVLCFVQGAQALDVDLSGYLDWRLIAPTGQQAWDKGGLGKFRFGNGENVRFGEAVLQANAAVADGLSAQVTARAEPTDSSVVDLLEAYALYAPKSEGDVSWSVKAGAFFPAISLENDDIGWASPYTLTPSAINSWIGEEIRTLGGEANLRWNTGGAGTLIATGALLCCNDEAGILMADRGWAMDDRPTGLFERLRMPDATYRLFRAPTPFYSGMFDEIDNRLGWYGGLTWQLPAGLGKLQALRYSNTGDPAAVTGRDTGWETKFWSFGARTDIAGVTLIAQQLTGYTAVEVRGAEMVTKFQSAFLLASYDWNDFRFSAREDLFQTRHDPASALFVEDGNAFTAAISWTGVPHLRVTAEVIAMDSRRGEYTLEARPAQLDSTQGQLSLRYSFD
ncbi:MAG: hypothetical protein JO256_07500 [Alphaproteobacteria bacterium]|nr:hypothetical protein [Alphaproteobacteria bacterium]